MSGTISQKELRVAILADTEMVPNCQGTDGIATNYPEAKQDSPGTLHPLHQSKPITLSLISESLEQANLSTSTQDILLSSLCPAWNIETINVIFTVLGSCLCNAPYSTP